MKVYEFAKEIGIETLVLMDKIREWKLPVKSHMAPLDEDLITEIRSRLQAEQPAPEKKPKKVATRRAAASSQTAKATKTPKTTKPAAKVEKPAEAVVAKRGPAVIRRKAGAEKEEAAEAPVEAESITASTNLSEHPIEETISASEAATTGEKETKVVARRGNIIGRMDLKRVATSVPSATASRPMGLGDNIMPGPPGLARGRAPQRNIRTGFVAPSPTEIFEEEEKKEKDKAVKKRPGAKEEPVTTFSASDFRKREVIFQPKKKRPMTGRDPKKTMITTPKASKRIVRMYGTIKVGELAMQMGLKAPELIKKLMGNGVMATVNTDLDFDTVALTVGDWGWEAQNLLKTVNELVETTAFGELDAEPKPRPPVVTVMGHVDHGKTTLLDAIRSADVASGEAGGITQHIGAYSVTLESGEAVTFIDTPGHEAFTAMRARGANATDVAIIVVAADDGVMPQTAEAINHAKAAKVPIIVAVNKIDKPGANVDRIKQQLTEFEIVPEEWGGNTIFCEVSALQKTGIKELLEQILVQAEVLELKANPLRSGTGLVIESRVERGRGSVATLLVQNGTVRTGDAIAAGPVSGRIRSMHNDRGETVSEVGPGYPVEVTGLPEPPQAGDRFDICIDEEVARTIAEQARAGKVEAHTPATKLSLDQVFAKVKTGDVKELALVLKADVAGSLEAIKGMLDKMEHSEVKVKLIHSAVGGITESDILLASAAQGLAVGFNVRPDGGAQRIAKEKGVEIKTYSIIYELQDDIKKAMSGLLAPEFVEKTLGRAEVRNTFVVPKIGTIAGCAVVDGKIARNNSLRLVRDGKIIYEGKVSSLKRFKDDAREVSSGFECGIGIENFNDIKVGDVIEAFSKEAVAREI